MAYRLNEIQKLFNMEHYTEARDGYEDIIRQLESELDSERHDRRIETTKLLDETSELKNQLELMQAKMIMWGERMRTIHYQVEDESTPEKIREGVFATLDGMLGETLLLSEDKPKEPNIGQRILASVMPKKLPEPD